MQVLFNREIRGHYRLKKIEHMWGCWGVESWFLVWGRVY